MDRKTLIAKARAPWGLHEAIDSKIDEYVNQPLARAGHEDLGASLSAGLSTAGALLPDSAEDVALAALPYGKLSKGLRKMAKPGPALKYSEMGIGKTTKFTPESFTPAATKELSEKAAESLGKADLRFHIDDQGNIIKLNPKQQMELGIHEGAVPAELKPKDLWSNELEAAEKASKIKPGK
jgi:hypothetical protein